jgi:cell division septation protein DedD
MKASPLVMMASALAVFLPGCGTTGEPAPAHAPSVPAPAPQAPDSVQFHTQTDTVRALRASEHTTVGVPGRAPQIRFMVQIGAFKDPHRASVVQAEARKRYHMPVLNDYFAGSGLYQIRIGFFESRDTARVFQQQMRKEFPSEYTDSWIVQLKR